MLPSYVTIKKRKWWIFLKKKIVFVKTCVCQTMRNSFVILRVFLIVGSSNTQGDVVRVCFVFFLFFLQKTSENI